MKRNMTVDYGIEIFWTQVVFKYVFYNYRTVDFHQNFLLDCYIFLQNKSFQWQLKIV